MVSIPDRLLNACGEIAMLVEKREMTEARKKNNFMFNVLGNRKKSIRRINHDHVVCFECLA